jgi:hypothetical protein
LEYGFRRLRQEYDFGVGGRNMVFRGVDRNMVFRGVDRNMVFGGGGRNMV